MSCIGLSIMYRAKQCSVYVLNSAEETCNAHNSICWWYIYPWYHTYDCAISNTCTALCTCTSTGYASSVLGHAAQSQVAQVKASTCLHGRLFGFRL